MTLLNFLLYLYKLRNLKSLKNKFYIIIKFHFTLKSYIYYVHYIIFCIVRTGNCDNLVHDKYKLQQKTKSLFIFSS